MKKIVILILSLCLLTSCAANDTVATVGKTKITKGEFEFYLSSIKSQLSGTELQTEEDWQTQEIEGEKAIDVAKRRALEIAINNAEYCEASKAQGITLTEAEKKQVKDTKEQVIKSYGGETAYNAFLKNNNITDSFIEMMCESTAYYQKITDKVKEEDPITEEDAKEYFEKEKNALSSEYRKAKHILILTQDATTGEAYTEEQKLDAKEFAESIYERVQNGDDFDALMRKYSQDPGLANNPQGYVFTTGEMVAEFEQAVDSVSAGGFAFCETTYGYHIIKRLSLEYEDVADKVKDTILRERVHKIINQWEKDHNLTVTTNDELIKSIK